VREGVALAKQNGIDFILAVGGGSVIDSAKAIAAGALYEGDVWDFYTWEAQVTAALPVGVVLTIPAAGSEASTGSVITDWENNNKRHCDSELFRPRFAILNPELTYTLPPYQTACGTADIMAHLMERYFTNEPDVELTDRMIEAVLKTVIGAAPDVLAEPENYAARAEIMWAGTIAHNDLLTTGRVGDWASHMIEHELSAINDIAHGAGLAVIIPAWMKYVFRHDVRRFVQYAVRVWGVEQDVFDPEKTALCGIARTKDYFKSLGLPTSLSEIGIGDDAFADIAAKCRKFDGDTVGNFIKLDPQDIVNILTIAK
jgi:alcohol dehydrogenase YqhD (iron-dependent ADH family)